VEKPVAPGSVLSGNQQLSPSVPAGVIALASLSSTFDPYLT
jgi:hypothetical protein